MARIKRVVERENGWSEWIVPRMTNYRMVCCDCGLSHDLEFQALQVINTSKDGSRLVQPLNSRKHIVQFRARRNNRSTAQIRRKH